MANHFNDLLLQTLKDVGIRLERLEGRVDHIINEKADKVDVQDLRADIHILKVDVQSLNADIQDMKADGQNLRADVHILKADIQDMKADGQSMKADIQNLKADVQDMKADIHILKADGQSLRADMQNIKTDVQSHRKESKADFNALSDIVQSHAQRLDRIETGIKTLQWTMTAGLAILGIILAFVRSC